SNNADQTIERILNFFPESAHKNVLMNLALNLRAVISQRLAQVPDTRDAATPWYWLGLPVLLLAAGAAWLLVSWVVTRLSTLIPGAAGMAVQLMTLAISPIMFGGMLYAVGE
ncbi:hypothetical protein ABGA94_12540, partial [Stenotrophomonas sp. 3diitr2024]